MKQVEERYISFEASKMAYRDIKNSIDTAKREGKEEGLAEGMKKGFAEGVDPGAEPLALCSAYPVLPERSVCALHILYYQSGQYLLYADYAHMGLAKSRTRYSAFLDP